MTPGEIALMLWTDDDCLHELHVRSDGRPVELWIPCRSHRAFARMLTADECRMSVVPRTEHKSWATGSRASVVWAALQSGPATTALERFRPAPTVVLRAGRTHFRWALWALSRPLWGAYVEQATERLAYALHGLRRAAKAETMIPSPFTSLEGRRIWTEFETGEIYTARDVVGDLRDAPPIDGWRRAA